MNDSKIQEICCERLQKWTFKLLCEHSTPAILIGIGHDHKSGQITLCVPENFSNDDIMNILELSILRLDIKEPH
ncbi:hypothetical protein ES703_122255 [subsurface metagenome]